MLLTSNAATIVLVSDTTVGGAVTTRDNSHYFHQSSAWVKDGVLYIDRPLSQLRAVVVSASTSVLKEADGVRCTPKVFRTTYQVVDLEATGAFNSATCDEDGIEVDLTRGFPMVESSLAPEPVSLSEYLNLREELKELTELIERRGDGSYASSIRAAAEAAALMAVRSRADSTEDAVLHEDLLEEVLMGVRSHY